MGEEKKTFIAGITSRSIAASVACMLIAGIYINVTAVDLGIATIQPEQIIPPAAMSLFLALIGLSGLLFALTKTRLLNRAEMLCVFYTLLFSIPMMTQGTWHRLVGLIAAPARSASFDYIDAYSDNLWPHGSNLLKDTLNEENTTSSGDKIRWTTTEYETGIHALLPTITNDRADDNSTISIEVPLTAKDREGLIPSFPHLFSVLARLENPAPTSACFVRIYEDGSSQYREILNVRDANKTTFIHQKGFVRLGIYGLTFSPSCREKIRIELGLRGRGTLSFADPKLFSVSALEGSYKGRKVILESDWNALPPEKKIPGILIKPDNLISVAGIKYLFAGNIPLEEWAMPAITWGSLLFFLLASTLAVNIIMRKQWAESERYPFPNARIPMMMIGEDDAAPKGYFAEVWRNPALWAGLLVALIYSAVVGWHEYNPKVPDIRIDVPLQPYFSDPGWGRMWGTSFTVSIFFLSIALFFELNVLISLAIGFWLFRSLYWIGEFTGWKSLSGYPWRYQQAVGAYLGYFLAVLFFTRKYLVHVLKEAVKGGKESEADVLSYRGALLLLIGSFAGAGLWASWIGTSVPSMLTFFSFLVTIGFVAAKLRAECGMVFGYFTPYNAMIFVALFGGMTAFGANGMMTALLCSGFITVSVFYYIPGAQLELIQFGRRFSLQPRHIIYACFLGLLGGLFIGGWSFLTIGYGQGGDNVKYQWAFNQAWFFHSYRAELTNATTEFLNAGTASVTAGPNWSTRTILMTGGISMLLTVFRQLFSGFWFHPIGFIFGSTHAMEGAAWGSILVAWVIRSLVLKFGGATSVRNKLQPFAVGLLAGTVIIIVLFDVIAFVAKATGTAVVYGVTP